MKSVEILEQEIILKCQKCDLTAPVPKHCGRQMTIVEDKLICWKGPHKPCCNSESVKSLPLHHNKPMLSKIL